MTTNEERLRVLNMIESGTISATEGAELLRALSQAGQTSETTSPDMNPPKRFRVFVVDPDGQERININLPVNLVKVGLKMGARFIPNSSPDGESHVANQVREAIKMGTKGKVADIENQEGERIQIFID